MQTDVCVQKTACVRVCSQTHTSQPRKLKQAHGLIMYHGPCRGLVSISGRLHKHWGTVIRKLLLQVATRSHTTLQAHTHVRTRRMQRVKKAVSLLTCLFFGKRLDFYFHWRRKITRQLMCKSEDDIQHKILGHSLKHAQRKYNGKTLYPSLSLTDVLKLNKNLQMTQWKVEFK